LRILPCGKTNKNMEVKINIIGRRVSLVLYDIKLQQEIYKTCWMDKKDIECRLLRQLKTALEKTALAISDIEHVSFNCDSPYFGKSGKLKMEKIDSSDKCGFTAWQTGEIFAKVANFAIAAEK